MGLPSSLFLWKFTIKDQSYSGWKCGDHRECGMGGVLVKTCLHWLISPSISLKMFVASLVQEGKEFCNAASAQCGSISKFLNGQISQSRELRHRNPLWRKIVLRVPIIFFLSLVFPSLVLHMGWFSSQGYCFYSQELNYTLYTLYINSLFSGKV